MDRTAETQIAWAIKDTTNPNYPYFISYHINLENDSLPIFRTKSDARYFVRKNKIGYKWKPTKVIINEVKYA